MKTMLDNCLTYEQLQSYSLNNSGKEEHAQQYMHISTCELCACAVNGFAAISFTAAEVDAIKHQIDVKTNATNANPLTFAQGLIAITSIVSIFAFYNFADSFSKLKPETSSLTTIPQVELSVPGIEEVIPDNEVPEHQIQEQKLIVSVKAEEKIFIPVEPMESISADLIPSAVKIPEVFIEPVYNADVIYIYDLKVTAYNDLYFHHNSDPFEMKGHTPSFKENKETENYLSESDPVIAVDRVLKAGLAHFGKEKYNKALEEFQSLLESNPDDVNALFYSAVSFYKIGKYNNASKNLEAVLSNSNNVFHPEAKWNLALVELKTGEKTKAKQLLSEIVTERGFYAKRAGEKLKGL